MLEYMVLPIKVHEFQCVYLIINYYFRWTKNRVVTSMDWSAVFPELLVASYDKNPDAAHDPDGVCLVWNTRFKKTTPEDIFHCQVLFLLRPHIYINLIISQCTKKSKIHYCNILRLSIIECCDVCDICSIPS